MVTQGGISDIANRCEITFVDAKAENLYVFGHATSVEVEPTFLGGQAGTTMEQSTHCSRNHALNGVRNDILHGVFGYGLQDDR